MSNKYKIAVALCVLQPLIWFFICFAIGHSIRLTESESMLLGLACFISCLITLVAIVFKIQE